MKHSNFAVVFDLDGTLVDSRADIAAAANYALAQCGFRTYSEAEIGAFVGDGAGKLMRRAAEIDAEDPRFRELLDTFLDYYSNHAAERTTLMKGADEALETLRGIPLAILTNKPRRPTLALLSALRKIECFAVIIAGGDFPYLKPDPRPLQHVAHQLKVQPHNVVMVGDGPQDIECGRAAQTKTIGVKGGIASYESLVASHPDRLIESLNALPEAIESLRSAPTKPQSL
jgi:phosphoglycolate phosphatase